MNKKGLSLVEMMVVLVLFSVVMVGLYRMIAPIATYFQHGFVRQKATNEARACMNTIGLAMRGGIATSARISTPAAVLPFTPVAWSRIDFALPTPTPLLSGTTAYTFTLVNGNVQMFEYTGPPVPSVPGAQLIRGPQVLATHVTNLSFVPMDVRDPSLIMVSLRIDAPLDSSNRSDRMATVELEQEIHMLVNY